MIIQNYSDLRKDHGLAKVLQILNVGLESAMPKKELKKILNSNKIQIGKKRIQLSNYDSVYLVAFGKAANSMTIAVNSIVKIKNGIVVVPKGTKSLVKNKKFQIIQSGHPIPNQTSVRAAKSIVTFLKQRKPGELVIFLVSGGSSALLAMPDGITLNDKVKMTKQLLVYILSG